MTRKAIPILALIAVFAVGCGVGEEPPKGSIPSTTQVLATSTNGAEVLDDSTCGKNDTTIYAPGRDRRITAQVRVCKAADPGTEYWVVVQALSFERVPGLYYPKCAIQAAATGLVQCLVTLSKQAESRSCREFFVASIPVAGADWMRQALAADGNGDWTGDRSELPTGAEPISNRYVSCLP